MTDGTYRTTGLKKKKLINSKKKKKYYIPLMVLEIIMEKPNMLTQGEGLVQQITKLASIYMHLFTQKEIIKYVHY